MIYLVVFALIILSVYQLKYYHNTYVKCISLYLFSLSLLLFFSLLQIIKTSNYQPSGYIDYYLLLIFSQLEFFYLGISSMVIVSMAAVIYSIYLLSVFPVNIKNKLTRTICGAVPLLFFIVLNHPETSFRLYLFLHTINYSPDLAQRYLLLFNTAFVMLYLLIPYVVLLRFFRRTDFYVKKRNCIMLAGTILISETLLGLLFFIGPLSAIFKTNISLLKIAHTSTSSNLSLLIIVCILLALVLIMTVILKKMPFIKTRLISFPFLTTGYTLSHNLRMTLHAYKNFFFVIEKMTYMQKKYIEEQNTQKILEINTTIEKISHDMVNTLCGQLNMLRDLHTMPKLIRLSDAVHSSLKKAVVNEAVTVTISDSGNNPYIIADSVHIEEAFLNLITNAVSAVESRHQNAGGKINIDISVEDDWSRIRITDNGNGINKKNMRKIFNMLFSTKQSNGNFGVGLYYVKKVIREHSGYIHVKSKEGEYTTFEVFIPIINKTKAMQINPENITSKL